VEPAGPACHTGQRSCFYRELGGSAATGKDAPRAEGEPGPAAHEALAALERTLPERQSERPEGSYTVELLSDPKRIGAKVDRGGRGGDQGGARGVRASGDRGGCRSASIT